MPWDFAADFRPPVQATDEDLVFSAFARGTERQRGFIERILKLEPKLRVRVRNLPPGTLEVTAAEGSKAPSVIEQPVALDSHDVPEVLKDRIEVPKAREFWNRNYHCSECVDPISKRPGLWVPHIRRLLHQVGEPLIPPLPEGAKEGTLHTKNAKAGAPFQKGLESSWMPNFMLYIGAPKRLAQQTTVLYSAALTTLPEDPKHLASFDMLFLLPIWSFSEGRAATDDEIESTVAKLHEELPKAEKIFVLSPSPKQGAAQVLEAIQELDPECMDGSQGGLKKTHAEVEAQRIRSRTADLIMGTHAARIAKEKEAKALPATETKK